MRELKGLGSPCTIYPYDLRNTHELTEWKRVKAEIYSLTLPKKKSTLCWECFSEDMVQIRPELLECRRCKNLQAIDFG